MTASNFLACFNETESFEGGDVDNPHDPGGATRKGVTQAVYWAWRKAQRLSWESVFSATDAEIQAIYRAQYWDAVRGDDLFAGLDLVMVDSGWGSGPVTAIEWLQRIVGAETDGHFGQLTLAGLADLSATRNDRLGIVTDLCDRREAFFRSLSTWRYFGVGWQRRLDGIRATAMRMVQP